MPRDFIGSKRKRNPQYKGIEDGVEEGAIVLSGDAAQVNYEETIPVWKQEVTDDRGRKRLHGAFTGGFSAGYFNTVGSKEGWTPSTFVSSRSSRYQGNEKKVVDYMDEEDLAEIEDDRQLRIRMEQQTKEQAEQEEVSAQPSGGPHLVAAPSNTTDNDGGNARQLTTTSQSKLAKLPAARGGSKTLSLLNDEDDLDGFDIGPKIRYDKALTKRKKTGALAQHTFQSRKVLRNPEPEPEVLKLPRNSPTRSGSADRPQESSRLLPSIGTATDPGTSHPRGDAGDPNMINPARLAQMANAGTLTTGSHLASPAVADTPVPPWRQQEANAVSRTPIPPWRRTEAPKAQVPTIGRHIALLALQSTFTPYAQNPEKTSRYRRYLEIEAGAPEGATHDPGDLDPDTWMAECNEFKKCAMMYKPMTGAMSQKFTSVATGTGTGTSAEQGDSGDSPLQLGGGAAAAGKVSRQVEAARAGRYGHLTRMEEAWEPARLLCKRFDVQIAAEGQGRQRQGGQRQGEGGQRHGQGEAETRGSEINRQALAELMRQAGSHCT